VSSWTKARSELAIKTQRLGPSHPETIAARRDFRAERLADYIEKVLSEAPELTDDQRTKLADLLQPARRAGGAI
jgi:hypothetical protein